MRSPILLISILVLMLMQAWMGVIPTRLICLPSPSVASACSGHLEAQDAACSSHDDADCGTGGHVHADAQASIDSHAGMHDGECLNHSHGLIGTLLHESHDCACHVHYPSDDDSKPAPGTQTRIDPVELRPLLTQSVAALLATVSKPSIFTPSRDGSIDLLLSQQVLGLKATRILV
jgi:hypothetical protein